MANKQNTYTSILAALSLLPQLVHSAQQSGNDNTTKHQTVFNAISAILQVGGALAAANNPALAPLINAAIPMAVDAAKATGWAEPAPVAVVTMPTNDIETVMPDVKVAPAGQPVTSATPTTPTTDPEVKG